MVRPYRQQDCYKYNKNGETEWTCAAVHDWLAEWKPSYVIDINRDTQLQDSYADVEHKLIVGVARITSSQFAQV